MAYEKQNFKSGSKLYASQLNAMDEQISKNESDLVELAETVGGKIGADELNTAVEAAMTEAKESGEFDGPHGADGKDGVSVISVKQTTTSTADGGTNVITVTLSNGQTATFEVKNGSKGSTGASGKDGSNGSDGSDGVGIKSVKQTTTSTDDDGNNIITVTLTDGTTSAFTVQNGSKGSTGAAGKDGSDANVTSENIKAALGYTPADAEDVARQSEAIVAQQTEIDNKQPKGNYALKSELAAETTAREAAISDLNVRIGQQHLLFAEGDTVEDAIEWLKANGDTSRVYVLPDGFFYEYKETIVETDGAAYTNLLPKATDTDGVTIYGGDYNGDGVNDGYKTETRLSGSNGNTGVSAAPMCASGFIPAKNGDVIRIKGAYAATGTTSYVISYNSAKTKIINQIISQTADLKWANNMTWATVDKTDDNLLTFTLSSDNFGTDIEFIRFNSDMTSGNTIITINQEIKEGGGTTVVETWASTGQAFVPTNYDSQIANLTDVTDTQTKAIAELKEAVKNGAPLDVDALDLIRNWDSPIYDRVPTFQLSQENPAVTENDKKVPSIYAKYDALVETYPNYITKTDLGACSDGVTHVYRYDFCEPEPHHQSGMQWSETKPVIICASGIHWEWGGVYSLYYALSEIASNPELDDLRRNVHFVVVPIINPYCFTDIGAYSETYGVLNANGVQIHRNFEVGFIYPGESGYVEAGNRNHGGTEPLSEIETQNIDNIFKQYPDAALFLTCHSAQRDTRWGTGFIWASTATNYTCNLGYRLIDKMSKAWHAKYGTTWEEGCVRENEYVLADHDTYPNAVQLADGDYRAGHAHVSSTDGTETRQATKYGIQGANVEVLDTFWVLSSTGLDGKVTTHGAETYINYLLMYMGCYDHKDKKQYYVG